MISLRKQQGVNLVELMVVGFLMVLIGYFMIQIMHSSNESSSRSDGIAQAHETARLALAWLHQDLKRAGFSADLQEPRTQPFADICTGANNVPPNLNGNCTFESTLASDNDRLAILRTFSTDSDDPKDSMDCTGADLTGTIGLIPEESILADVYWVDRDRDSTSGTSDGDDFDDVLRCATYNHATGVALNSATLASGVEGLQAIYAESDAGFGTASAYVSADRVDMNNVYAIRVSILSRSFSDFALDQVARSYILLDASPYTFTDRVPRQILTTTTALKNYSEQQ